MGVDVVGVAGDIGAEAVVVLHGDFHINTVFFPVEIDRIGVDDFHIRIQELHKFSHTAFVAVVFHIKRVGGFQAFVNQSHRNAAVQKCQVAQTVGKGAAVIDGIGENGPVGLESHFGTALVGIAEGIELSGGHAPGKFNAPGFAVAVNFHFHPIGKGVHAAYTHAVQTAGNFVAVVVEFTTGVEHGQHHFHSGLAFGFVHIHGDTAAVVQYGNTVVGVNSHFHTAGVTGESFVDGVIHHFVNQMVQTFECGIADVHGRAHTHRFQTFQHGDLAGRVFRCRRSSFGGSCGFVDRIGFFDFVGHYKFPVLYNYKNKITFV